MELYRLVGDNFLYSNGKYHQKIPNKTKGYIAFSESAPMIMMVQKHVIEHNVTKGLLSRSLNNCSKTNVILGHNICSICPPPVCPIHVWSLFLKHLMVLLINSWGKSSQIIYNAIFNILSSFTALVAAWIIYIELLPACDNPSS